MTSPARFRKKPVEIEAIRWDGPDPDPAVEEFCGESFETWLPSQQKLEVNTLEGPITASPGDWLVRGVQGEVYPVKPAIFDATYEATTEHTLVPHPVEVRIVTVVADGQQITEEQRLRIYAWLEANEINPKRVAQSAIKVYSRLHGDRVGRQIIEFREYYETPDGHRVINEKTLNEALTYERWVEQKVPLEPDPAWEGWDAAHARMEAQKKAANAAGGESGE